MQILQLWLVAPYIIHYQPLVHRLTVAPIRSCVLKTKSIYPSSTARLPLHTISYFVLGSPPGDLLHLPGKWETYYMLQIKQHLLGSYQIHVSNDW